MTSLPLSNKKPVKIGNSYYFSVPKAFLDAEILFLHRTYNLKIYKLGLLISSIENVSIIRSGNTYYICIDHNLLKDNVIGKATLYDLRVDELEDSEVLGVSNIYDKFTSLEK